jgi:hypothetical protein
MSHLRHNFYANGSPPAPHSIYSDGARLQANGGGQAHAQYHSAYGALGRGTLDASLFSLLKDSFVSHSHVPFGRNVGRGVALRFYTAHVR